LKKQGFDDYQIYNVPKHPDNPEYMNGWTEGEQQHWDDMARLEQEVDEYEAEAEHRDYDDDYD